MPFSTTEPEPTGCPTTPALGALSSDGCLPDASCPTPARVGQAFSEMAGTYLQTWIAGLAPKRDVIGSWAVGEIGTFGSRRNQHKRETMEPW